MIKQLLILLLFIYASATYAQGLSCAEVEPFCAGGIPFPNTHSGIPGAPADAEPGIDYSCSLSDPQGPPSGTAWNYPVWYYLRINSDGDLIFTITQTVNEDGSGGMLDVDFIVWGPFTDENVDCGADLTNTNKVDCSYSASSIETMTLNGALEGEIYVVMVSNFRELEGYILIEQDNADSVSAGSTDCSIVNTYNYCEGEIIDLDATTSGAVNYEWFQDGTPLAETGPILSDVEAPSAVYSANALDIMGVIVSSFEFIINFEMQPVANIVPDMLQCDGDNNGKYLFDLESQTAQILGAQDSTEFTVTYHISQDDANVNENALTSPYENISNPQTIYARIENNELTDCYDTTSFAIQVFDTPIAYTIPNQLICDDDNDGVWSFDLTSYNSTVLDSQDSLQFTVSYHLSQADADANEDELTSPYSNVTSSQNIFVRIENNDNIGCFDTTSFQLEVFDVPIANAVPNQLICDDDNDGFWSLDINALSEIVLGTQNAGDYTITYHANQDDANSNSSEILSPYTNVAAYQEEEIFIRIENKLNYDCYDTSSFMFDVFEQPSANTVLYGLCDDNTDGNDTNGFVTFDLASVTAQVLDGQDPLQFDITYHTSQADADANASALPLSYINATADFQQIVARVENIDNNECYETALIDLAVYELPTVAPIVELFQCDDNTDGYVNFNLTEANEMISADFLNETFTYYLTPEDIENGDAIADPIAYTNRDPSANPDILFVKTENLNGCYRVSQLELLVSTTAIPSGFQLAYEVCDDTDIDGDDHNGIATFDFSDSEPQIQSLFPLGQALTITYFETLDDALAETNAIPDISNHRNDASPNVQNIYVRIDSDIDNACLGLGHHITLSVNPVPDVIDVTDFIVCEDNSDGIYDFDLDSKTSEVLNGQDSTLYAVTYHTTQADSDSGGNALVSPYANIDSNPQQIYVRITNTVTSCYKSVVNFSIEVQEEVQANQNMPIFYLCDEFGDDDEFAEFDLRSQDVIVLDGQDSTDYSVTYYLTQLDADLAENQLIDNYENITNPQTIYARVDDITINNSICWATTELTLQVNPLPMFDLEEEYLLCINTNGTEVTAPPILETGLSAFDYSFEWVDATGTLVGAGSSFVPLQGGTYTVMVTDIVTGCENSDTALVNVSEPPALTAQVTTLAFADEHVIQASVTGSGIGVYEFCLDNGRWQDSDLFADVTGGTHIVTARDKNGCGVASTEVIVIDYPLYFTPNNDGYHDTWNIYGIGSQSNAKIYIFDRYGKLLKQLSPTGEGWDGSYNGLQMPSSDYWFTVEYEEPNEGVKKQFNAHFSLKR